MSLIKSLAEYFGQQQVNHCGYCKTKKGHRDYGSSIRYKQGMWLHFLDVNDYQNLIDRGWRRSGLYGYKPVMTGACCALYTIRCGALDLRLTKSQKKLIKRFNRFIMYDERRKSRSGDMAVRGCEEAATVSIKLSNSVTQLGDVNIEKPTPSCSVTQPAVVMNSDVPMTEQITAKEIDTSTRNQPREKGTLKKKTIRFERAKRRIMLAKGKTEEEAIEILKLKRKIPKSKTIEDFLLECEKPNAKHKLEVKLVQSSPWNKVFEMTFNEEYNVYLKYQTIIHKDDPNECTVQQFCRFLVRSPLQPKSINRAGAPVASFGSYHQQYWLDGKLIAVGVIDILPYCVSSVYFFYDPDYNDLVLGSYGSMKELQLARELHKFEPSVQYYYMGFYIHTCPKMMYKARISPSYLLCPETFTFQPIKQCLDKISKYGVCRLHPDPDAKDECYTDSLDRVTIIVDGTVMPYPIFRHRYNLNDEDEIKEFAKLVGNKCVRTLVLSKNV